MCIYLCLLYTHGDDEGENYDKRIVMFLLFYGSVVANVSSELTVQIKSIIRAYIYNVRVCMNKC